MRAREKVTEELAQFQQNSGFNTWITEVNPAAHRIGGNTPSLSSEDYAEYIDPTNGMPQGHLQVFLKNRLLAEREKGNDQPLKEYLVDFLEDAAVQAGPDLSAPAQRLSEARSPHQDDLKPSMSKKNKRINRVVGSNRAYTGPTSKTDPDMPSQGVFRWTPHGQEEVTWKRYDC